jgi:hypothetical protein
VIRKRRDGVPDPPGPGLLPRARTGHRPAQGVSSGCTATAQVLIDEIVANPSAFYNVHTSDFPAGALRGQLG